MIFYGIKLMVVGMGTVFLFLILLILSMNLVSILLKPFGHILQEKHVAIPRQQGSVEKTAPNGNLITVIAATIHQYRIRGKK